MQKRVAVVIVIVVIGVAAFGLIDRRFASDVAETDGDPRQRLEPYLRKAGVTYPPRQMAMLVFKDERRLTLWARSGDDWRFIRHYTIHAASGHAGPKLREGDRQVPEGVYRIEHLNPNSRYHLSMKVSYPNAFDRQMARLDRRTRLGGDIFIHGKAVSIGCVAVGDRAIEELFALVKAAGVSTVKVIIAPNDLRTAPPIRHEDAPSWTPELYRDVAEALRAFPVAKEGMPNARVAFR